MDGDEYKKRKLAVVKAARTVRGAISDYGEDDVTAYDIRFDEHVRRLDGIRKEFTKFADLLDDLYAEVEDDNEENEHRAQRMEDLMKLRKDLQKDVKVNEKEVKAKAVEMIGDPKESPKPIVEKSEASEKEARELKGRKAKLLVIQRQIMDKAKDLRREVEKKEYRDPNSMKELEVREAILESKDWVKKRDETRKLLDSYEQESAMLGVNTEKEVCFFGELEELVRVKIEELKLEDKKKGYYAVTGTKPKENVVYPKPFEGILGTNVYKWCREMKDAIESAQVREEDRVKKVKQYLSGDAKVKVGEFHETMDSALTALESYYGNPRAIWGKCKRDLESAVGDFKKDWGTYGTQKRVMAIARTEDFIREAEMLAKEFAELENEIYSSGTTSLLSRVLPREYSEKVNDTIADVNSTEQQKVEAIKKFLEVKKRSAVLGVDIDKEQDGAGRKVFSGVNASFSADGHDCSKEVECNKAWGLLGCTQIYKLDNARDRRDKIIQLRGCMRCGDPFRKERDGSKHRCKWEGNKVDAKCQFSHCWFGAAVCKDHEESPNCSRQLLDWLRKGSVTSNVFNVLSEVNSCRSERSISDDQVKSALVKKAKIEGVKEKSVLDIPKGKGMFELCLIKGKTRPLCTFIDSGADGWVVRDDAVGELHAVKLAQGPIPLNVASGKVVNASGEWGALIPMAGGDYQVVRGLSLPNVTAEMPELNLRGIFKRIQQEHPHIEDLQNMEIPETLGKKVDMILGQRYKNLHPEPVIKLPSGLTVYKSKLLPWSNEEIATIGGPMDLLNELTGNPNVEAVFEDMVNLLHTVEEMEADRDMFSKEEIKMIDMDIPGASELMRQNVEKVENLYQLCGQKENQQLDVCELCGCEEETLLEQREYVHSVQGDLGRFLKMQSIGLDVGYRCLKCRGCEPCKMGAGKEKLSLVQEKEQDLIRRSVEAVSEESKVEAWLPFKLNPDDHLVNNRNSAVKRLDTVLRKYEGEKDTMEMIEKAFKKLEERGTLVYLEDLSKEERNMIEEGGSGYYLPWDISFKVDSVSTPARPTFDGSATTGSGYSLNSLLAIGIPDLAVLLKIMLEWTMGPEAMTGDISQFYCSVILKKCHWKYQRIVVREGLKLNGRIREAVITKLIFGVSSSSSQCEEAVKNEAMENMEKNPTISRLLLYSRYVDDFLKSLKNKNEGKELAKGAEEMLRKIGMKVKGWVFSGEDPCEEMSSDGKTVKVGGAVWYPKEDEFTLGISPLFFGKKKRGRIPKDIEAFEGKGTMKLVDFVPENISRRKVTSVVCRFWDPLGKGVPISNKLKCDLRGLVKAHPLWDSVISNEERTKWMENFALIENMKEVRYSRSSIPQDALRLTARIFVLCDAAKPAMVVVVYAGYERKNGEWSCGQIFGKGLLSPEDKTLPQLELQALSTGADVKVLMESAMGDWVEDVYIFSDSEICLAWCSYESIKLNVFQRNRVVNVLGKVELNQIMHVKGKLNCADIGTRPAGIEVKDVSPGSVWMTGYPWMRQSIEDARNEGVIKGLEDIKLENDQKKALREGITFDEFDEMGKYFGVMVVSQVKTDEVIKRAEVAQYLYLPINRNFDVVVRITALVIGFVIKLKDRVRKRKGLALERREVRFRMFSKINFFKIRVANANEKYVEITELELSEALQDIFMRATREVKEFVSKKILEKTSIEIKGILMCKSRVMDGQEVRVLGELRENESLSQITTANFQVPLVEYQSPLAISLAYHFHYLMNHKGADSTFRLSLEYVHILKGKHHLRRIGAECVVCLKKEKKYMEQVMAPFSDEQLTITPIFYYCLMDTYGPFDVFCPGYERNTRKNKPYKAHMMVVACCATGSVNCQVLEGLDNGSIMDGLNRFFCETCVPVFMFPDQAGAMLKALTRGEIDLMDLSGSLKRQRGIEFRTCPPQGHSAHGRIERKIGLIQESLTKSGMGKSRTTYSGWQTVAKLVEREINGTPLGYLSQKTSQSMNPLLRLLTPSALRLQTRTDRAPRSTFNIPNHPKTIMTEIDRIYGIWYGIWARDYVPLVMGRDIWQKEEKNLAKNDIVWFKLTESGMSAEWRLGKVESVRVGRDGLVRDAMIAYKNMDEEVGGWTHMVVERPIRNMVKLFSIGDTTLIEDMKDVREACLDIMEEELGKSEQIVLLALPPKRGESVKKNEEAEAGKSLEGAASKQEELPVLLEAKKKESRESRILKLLGDHNKKGGKEDNEVYRHGRTRGERCSYVGEEGEEVLEEGGETDFYAGTDKILVDEGSENLLLL